MTGRHSRGRIVEVRGSIVEFHPAGTTYRLHLQSGPDTPPGGSVRPAEVLIRVRARKIWTVPSGGLFIEPIVGQPRTLQGRVRHLDLQQMVLNVGTNLVVDLPSSELAYDLTDGPIEVGKMVNVAALPGATIELAEPAPVES